MDTAPLLPVQVSPPSSRRVPALLTELHGPFSEILGRPVFVVGAQRIEEHSATINGSVVVVYGEGPRDCGSAFANARAVIGLEASLGSSGPSFPVARLFHSVDGQARPEALSDLYILTPKDILATHLFLRDDDRYRSTTSVLAAVAALLLGGAKLHPLDVFSEIERSTPVVIVDSGDLSGTQNLLDKIKELEAAEGVFANNEDATAEHAEKIQALRDLLPGSPKALSRLVPQYRRCITHLESAGFLRGDGANGRNLSVRPFKEVHDVLNFLAMAESQCPEAWSLPELLRHLSFWPRENDAKRSLGSLESIGNWERWICTHKSPESLSDTDLLLTALSHPFSERTAYFLNIMSFFNKFPPSQWREKVSEFSPTSAIRP